jgi:hypothetical protein
MPASLPDLTGWPLDEARALLQAAAPHCRVAIVETAPPRLREGDRLGALRVLRQRVLRGRAGEDELELLVAREQIGEARARQSQR